MVGDSDEADAATRDFQAYWEDNAALAGGVLVYNTGRCVRWRWGGCIAGQARVHCLEDAWAHIG